MFKALNRHINNFSSSMNEWNFTVLSSHPNLYLCVLKEHRDKEWNWSLLARHPNFSWEWVREFPHKPWDWAYLSVLPCFTWNWVREFPNKHWNWNVLSNKPDITIDIIKEFEDRKWNWYTLTMHPSISTGLMMENPNFPWKIEELLFTDIDEDIIRYLRYYRSHYDHSAWADHTMHTPWRLIKANMDLPWVYFNIILKTFEDFKIDDIKYLNENWNWKHLSEMVDYSIIKMHPELPWDMKVVSRNPTLHYRDVTSKWNLNTVNLKDEMNEWNASNVIKRYWKRCVTDPSYKMCQKILLNDSTLRRFTEKDNIDHE